MLIKANGQQLGLIGRTIPDMSVWLQRQLRLPFASIVGTDERDRHVISVPLSLPYAWRSATELVAELIRENGFVPSFPIHAGRQCFCG
jgi:hypothetical protein